MLHAYLERKLARAVAGRDLEAGLHHSVLAARLRRQEDPLTAMVFGRLAYLPADLAWRVIVEAATVVRGGVRPALPGPVFTQAYWPRFGPDPKEDDERTYVEPDLVWSWPAQRAALVFEVKWNQPQSVKQLDDEWTSAREHFGDDTAITLVALGGATPSDWDGWRSTCRAERLLALGWPDLWAAVARLEQDALEPHELRIVHDLLAICRDRGGEVTWLSSLPARSVESSTFVRTWKPVEVAPVPLTLTTLPASSIDPKAINSWRPNEQR